MKKQKLATVFLLLVASAAADSLWSPDFSGYLAGGVTVQEGDTVFVTFSEGFSLSFKSAGTDSKRLILELSGGPYGDLLSFLPTARTSGDRSVRGDTQAVLKGSLAASVTGVEAGSKLTLQGLRVLVINGREESVELKATVNARDLSQDRTVNFARLVEPHLLYRGPTEPSDDAIRAEDLVAILAGAAPPAIAEPPTGVLQPAAGVPAAAAPVAAQPQPPAAAAPVQPQQTRYQLTDERRRELLLRYINRIVDVLF